MADEEFLNPDEYTTLYIIGYFRDNRPRRMYKFGKSKVPVENKIKELQAGNHKRLIIKAELHRADGVSDIEQRIRAQVERQFPHNNKIWGKDWFEAPAANMEGIANDFGMTLKK